MVQLCGPSAVPRFELLRFLLISYCVESGGYLLAVTLQLCIIIIPWLPSLFNVIHSRSLSLCFILLIFVPIWLSLSFVSPLSAPLCFVVLTLFMVNATIKYCDTQYAMCADVIRVIRLSELSYADFEYNIIQTIHVIILIIVCSTTPVLVCHNINN